MAYRIAINGFGRIGRSIVRAIYGNGLNDILTVAAINDVTDFEIRSHLIKYDSVHGIFPFDVSLHGDSLGLGPDTVRLLKIPSMAGLPWKSLGIDLVLDCSGLCHTRGDAMGHLDSGAGRVLLSYPGPVDVDRTVIFGVNHRSIEPGDLIVSNASCTSNCLIPVLKALDDTFTIEKGMVTTIHSVMNDQPAADAPGRMGLRRSRSGLRSIVPIDTHLAEGVARVLPGLEGRLKALALRVPVMNVSALDISVLAQRDATPEEVNNVIDEFGAGKFCGVMGLEREPLVSCDFRHDARSAVVDAGTTMVTGGNLIRLLAWFDNEWAYAVRMCDTALSMLNVSGSRKDGKNKNNNQPIGIMR